MNCLGEERLILLADGLAPEPAEEAHLAGCSRCADALQGFRDANALVAEFLPPVPFAEVDDGLSFGPYTGCREIACGAMSRVYRGRDAEGREVAVKVCRDSALLDSFSNEVKMLQRCAAAGVPGVIPLLDARLEHLPAFIVTPYCPRGTLSRQIQEKRVDDELVLGVASGLAETLAALAELGIVHGDLKASNILLDQAGRPCLADLGGARRVEVPGQSSTLSHKGPGHMSLISMSPEQARGQELSPASDIFSLGVILYQLATDRHPFAGGTSWEMASRILTETPADPRPLLAPRFRGRFAELLEACLAKDPSLRPAAAALVEDFLKIPEKPVNSPASLASLVEPKAPRNTNKRIIVMSTLFALSLVATLVHFNAPAETAKPGNGTNSSVSHSQHSSASISTRTDSGQTVITFNGKEVWKGPTTKPVKCQSINCAGTTFAVAFEGDNMIWESAEGAAAKILEIEKDKVDLLMKKISESSPEMRRQAKIELKALGVAAQPTLKTYCSSSDPEIAQIANQLVGANVDADASDKPGILGVYLDEGQDGHLTICGFYKGSPAENRLLLGDVIKSMDGINFINYYDFQVRLKNSKCGDKVKICYSRNNVEFTEEFMLGDREKILNLSANELLR